MIFLKEENIKLKGEGQSLSLFFGKEGKMKIIIGNFRIQKETEKAYLIKFQGDTRDPLSRTTTHHPQGLFYGAKEGEEFWVPKSAIAEFHEKYIIANWWKTRNGDLILDAGKWPGVKIRIVHEGNLAGYDIHKLEEYDARLWKIVFEKIEKDTQRWERKKTETGHVCDMHPEGYKIIYGKDVEVVIPEKVWKEICIEAKI
jgi:hypothetical protein